MPGTIFLNEARIQLDVLKSLSVFRCPTPEISSRHKNQVEQTLRREQKRASIFEGNVLFAMPTSRVNVDDDKQLLFKYLLSQKRDLKIRQLAIVPLSEVPERVIDRITFALLSYQAEEKGIFTIYGRTLFRPTILIDKMAHKAVDVSFCIEDDYLKMYFAPTFMALAPIEGTSRCDKMDLELVGLCSYRNKSLCSLVRPDGSCNCLTPGRLGYYVDTVNFEQLDEASTSYVEKRFQSCPKFRDHVRFVLVKSSKKGTKLSAYPSYTVFSKLSRVDLDAKPQLLRLYREATLMLSAERWTSTNEWMRQIFSMGQESLQSWGAIKVNQVEIPVAIVSASPFSQDQKAQQGVYKAFHIPDQQVVNDNSNPTPQNLSGGWLFANRGAFDRRDTQRPFKTVSPYLVLPNNEDIVNTTRQLLQWLSNTKYTSRVRGDQDFVGINLPENKGKYNTSLINTFEDEENLHYVDGTLESYHATIQNIKIDWNVNAHKDPNKIVIVVIPEAVEYENSPYYLELKKELVEEGIPSQFITVETLNKLNDTQVAFGPVLQSLWLNIYAKMGGKPWRLAHQLGNVHCFIGIGFGINPNTTQNHIFAGVAHVFDNYGSWIDIASDSANLTASELENFDGSEKFTQGSSSFKISQNVTQGIVYNGLKLYQQKQTKSHEPATNIILHKLGKVYECEVIGFLEGIRQVLGSLGDCHLGILQIEQEHNVRLYGEPAETKKENHTIYRGSTLQFNQFKVALATTGRSYRQTSSGLHTGYPGIGTPQPLLLTSIIPSQQILQKYGCSVGQFYEIGDLSKYTMALTQLHWGSIRDNIRLPVTALYAQKVADLISKTDLRINASLGFYRPWFL